MTLGTTISRFRRAHQAFGVRTAFWALVLRAVKRVVRCHVLRAMYITGARPRFTTTPAGLTAAFLDRESLDRVATDPSYDLPPAFVTDALAKGDECYGISDGDRLVAYGWYARTPTRLNDDLRVSFADGWVYMYKGLTLDPYRGQRLHAIGKTKALADYRARGYKGMVQCVDADNIGSLKSAYRMGYVDFGWVLAIRLLGRCFTWTTPGCAVLGMRVAPFEPAAPVLVAPELGVPRTARPQPLSQFTPSRRALR